MEDEARKIERKMREAMPFADRPEYRAECCEQHLDVAVTVATRMVEQARAAERERLDALKWWQSCTREEQESANFYADLESVRKRAEAAEQALSNARKAATEANDRHHEVMLKAERRVARLEKALGIEKGAAARLADDDGE